MALTPQQAAQKLHANPIHAGAGFIAAGLLLKTAVFVKIVAYACLTLGLVFLWEAFVRQTKEQNENA